MCQKSGSRVDTQVGTFGNFYVGPKLQLVNPMAWVITWHNLEDPSNPIYYTYMMWARVYNFVGQPESVVVDLSNPVSGISEIALPTQADGSYCTGINFITPLASDATFTASAGTYSASATRSVTMSSYSTYTITPSLPVNGQHFSSSNGLTFTWSSDVTSVWFYNVYIYNDTGFSWGKSSNTLPIAYDGPTLGSGKYYLDIRTASNDLKDVGAHLTFYIDS